jgi:hypothetical protein
MILRSRQFLAEYDLPRPDSRCILHVTYSPRLSPTGMTRIKGEFFSCAQAVDVEGIP